MKKKSKILFLTIVIGILLSCGSNISRNVTIDTHKIAPFKNLTSQKIAIIEVSSSNKQLPSIAEIMSMTFMEYGFNIVEQTYVCQVLREHHITLIDEKDMKQIQKVGKILKADKILLVSITEFSKGQKVLPGGCISSPSILSYVNIGVLARLIEVKGAETIWTGIATTQDVNLHTCLKRISEKFARRLTD
jgi:hypothetical protein